MRIGRLCVAAAALLLLAGAAAEGAATETAIDLAPEDVQRLEERLNALGYLGQTPDQTFETSTGAALESFQQANGLPTTGQPDESTWDALYAESAITRQEYLRRFAQAYREMVPLQSGDINSQVQTMQRLLTQYGYFGGTSDGVFGEATRRAVERFQMVNGLPVSGIADGPTLLRLTAEVPITWQGYLSEMSCAAGDAGLNVYVLQNKLLAMGYFDGACTGSFGDLTRAAVAAFQTENGLEATGAADAAAWELIYSGAAVALRRADVVQIGDAGESVVQIQNRLQELGYLGQSPTGAFDYATETALRLFQIAHELPATGRAGAETMNALMADAAQPMSAPAVLERFAAVLSSRSADVQSTIAENAARMVGTAFDAPDDPLYPGFALVQYVCVAAGLPITQPETLIRLADDPVEDANEVAAGNVVAFQTADGDSVAMLLTVGAGEGRVIYVKPDAGWVVMGYITQIDSVSIYRWAESAA